jgi:outer membrane immunogenic protein
MFRWSSLRFSLTLAGVLSASVLYNCQATAETSGDDKVLEKIAALEARMAVLETQNRQYKREAEEARAQVRATDKRFRLSNAAVPDRAAPIYKSLPANLPATSWTGAFWGASAGGAATRSGVTSSEQNLFTGTNVPSNLLSFVNRQDTLGSAGPGRGSGAMIDVFAGWNTQISNIVIGGQVEATMSNLTFDSHGSKTTIASDQNGPNGTFVLADFRPQVVSSWMTTALLRAGVLLNDQTLLYAIGGWTLAQLEAKNISDPAFFPFESFRANGWTAGAGIERKLDSNWSVRAEYRYTNFGTSRTTNQTSIVVPSPTLFETQVVQRQTQYDLSMQSGRIGIAYAFNPLR